MTSRYDVVISGASFAGLALARALSQASNGRLAVAVVDRLPLDTAGHADARAFALGQASKRLIDSLGAWEALAPEAQPVTRIEITDSALEDGVRPVVLTYDNHAASGEPATYIVPAPAVVAALKAVTCGAPGITVLAPAEIAAFEAGDAAVEIGLAGGETLSAALLVAAEGRRSNLRELSGIKSIGWGYGQTGIVTTVAHEHPHGGTAVQHFLPAGPFAILPLTGSRSCITWSEESAEARRIMTLDDRAFLVAIEKRFGGRLGRLTLAGPRQSWPLDISLAREFAAPRLALLGDTAHGVHPIAGQGLNLGLRDVAALAEAIIDAARLGLDIGATPVLERYERWRRFDSVVSAAAFDGLNRLFSTGNGLVRALRDAGLGAVDRLPGLKALLVEEAAGLTGELPRLMRGAPL